MTLEQIRLLSSIILMSDIIWGTVNLTEFVHLRGKIDSIRHQKSALGGTVIGNIAMGSVSLTAPYVLFDA